MERQCEGKRMGQIIYATNFLPTVIYYGRSYHTSHFEYVIHMLVAHITVSMEIWDEISVESALCINLPHSHTLHFLFVQLIRNLLG